MNDDPRCPKCGRFAIMNYATVDGIEYEDCCTCEYCMLNFKDSDIGGD